MGVTRTYVRGLVAIVRQLCIYVTRYDATIRKYIPVEAIPAYETLKDACEGFLEAIGDLPVNP